MTRMALIQDGHVITVNEIADDDAGNWPGYVIAETAGNPGDHYDHVSGTFTPPSVDTDAIFAQEKKDYLDTVRELRAQVLARLNGYGAALYLQDPPAQVAEKENCAMLIQGLLDITTIPAVLAATNIGDLMVAVKTEYARLVGLASTELIKAFRQVDV